MTADLQLLNTALASRYEVVGELGAGGMATVYRARDVRHGRVVAMKVLSPEESSTRNADRFLQEIRIAAGLAHPHIMPVFDSGEAAGLLFYTMPLVDGETLRDRLRRDGRLPAGDAVRLAREVADGLDCAHRAGIIHRDVKPENILLAHGHAILADFGIARSDAPGAGGTLTVAGSFVGTPDYMSPELLLGEAPPGPWSDLYALGCVLFEMLTGEPPHLGVSAQTTLANRVAKGPPRVREVRPEVAASLEVAIGRALANSANERYATAAAFAEALVATAGQASRDAEVSLVLRPFDAIGGDEALAFFADGITEEAIHDLSKVKALRVISRTSAMRLKGTDKDVRTIGREYGVRYVVTGSVRQAGEKVRVTSEIVDAVLDAPVWSGRVDGRIGDPFAIQEQVATGIVDALRVKLTAAERDALHTQEFSDPRAHECYRRATTEITSFSREGLVRAEALLETGIAIVGEHPLLCAAMGSLNWQWVNGGFESGVERVVIARRWLQRALEASPGLAEAHITLAWIALGMGEVLDAVRHTRRALVSRPHDSLVIGFACVLYWVLGRHDAMEAMVRVHDDVDPFETWGGLVSAVHCQLTGDTAGRDRRLDRVAGLADSVMVASVNGFVCAQGGDLPLARTWWSRIESGSVEGLLDRLGPAALAAYNGDNGPVLALASDPEAAALFRRDQQYGWFFADVLCLAGMVEEAVDVLATAVERGFYNVPMIESGDAMLAPLRTHPRFPEILAAARRGAAEIDAVMREALT